VIRTAINSSILASAPTAGSTTMGDGGAAGEPEAFAVKLREVLDADR
jgi:hypothetical protein